MPVVQAPQEATLDSNVLLRVATMGAQKARAMKSSAGAFDTDDFVSKLITFMGGRRQLLQRDDDDDDAEVEVDEGDETLDWDRIGRKAMAKSLRVPIMDFMCVSIDIVLRAIRLSPCDDMQARPPECGAKETRPGEARKAREGREGAESPSGDS